MLEADYRREVSRQQLVRAALFTVGKYAQPGSGDAVARGVLNQVHGLIGQVEQLRFGAGISRIRGYAHAGRNVDVNAGFLQPDRLSNQFVQAACHAKCVFLGCLRQQHDKFVSAIAEREVDQTALVLHGCADLRKQPGANQMTVGVVDVLEVVKVDKDQRKLKGVAVRAINLSIQHEIQMPGIVETCAVIRNREFVDSLNRSA